MGNLDRAGMHAWENALIVDLGLEADWAGLGWVGAQPLFGNAVVVLFNTLLWVCGD